MKDGGKEAITKSKLEYPKKANKRIRALLEYLNLNENDIHCLKLRKIAPFKPEPNECHINTVLMAELEGGKQEFGWLVWYDSRNDLCEAIFHSVWRDSLGLLHDVTPRQHNEKRVMFIIDANREAKLIEYEGKAALEIYGNIQILAGEVVQGINRVIGVVHSSLAREQGLIG